MTEFFNCKDCLDLLMDLMEGNLDGETEGKLREHLQACPPCVNFVDSYRSATNIAALLREQDVVIPPEMETRLRSFLRENI